MRRLKNELDVDFIGGQVPLTKEEEKAISDFIKAKKIKNKKLKVTPGKSIAKRQKAM